MNSSKRILMGTAAALVFGSLLSATNAVADGAGAFIGGMVTSRVLDNMQDRTDAMEDQAYYAQQSAQQQYRYQAPVQQAAPAKTPQQKLDELDSLAAGGYITQDEYRRKREAILDSM